MINRHQTEIGRRTRVFTRVTDRPGGLAELLQRSPPPAATSSTSPTCATASRCTYETGVELLIETRGEADRMQLVARLREAGYRVDELG